MHDQSINELSLEDEETLRSIEAMQAHDPWFSEEHELQQEQDSMRANNDARQAVTASDSASVPALDESSGASDQTEKHVPINREILEATLDVIRESLQADGGDVVLVNVSDDGVVTLDMVGACAGCPLSEYDMSEGIERILKEHVPGVTKVEPAMTW